MEVGGGDEDADPADQEEPERVAVVLGAQVEVLSRQRRRRQAEED